MPTVLNPQTAPPPLLSALLSPQQGPTGPASAAGGPAGNMPAGADIASIISSSIPNGQKPATATSQQPAGVSASPVHDFVRSNPGVDAKTVSQKFKLDPAVAQSVINDVNKQAAPYAKPMPAPPAGTQNGPIAAANTARLAVTQRDIDHGAPAATPAQVASGGNMPTAQPAAASPAPANQAPATAPGAQPAPEEMPQAPNWVKDPLSMPDQTPPLYAMNPDQTANYLKTGQSPADLNLPPATTNTTPAGPHHANTLQLLGKLAGPLAYALIGSGNPAAATALYNGYQTARTAQQARAQAAKQQQFENQIKQETVDVAKQKAQTAFDTNQMKALETAPDGKAALALYDSIDPTNSKGLRDTFLNPDGTVRQSNPFSKDAYKVDSLKQKYGADEMNRFWNNVKLWSGNPDAQKEIAQAYDKQSGTTDFTDALANGTGLSDSQVDKDQQLKIQQQRANTYSDIASARIKDILASAGLKYQEGKYIDAKTGEVVPLAEAEIKAKQATSDFLEARTGEVVPLAEAEIAYKNALGNAAGENAETNRIRAQTDAAFKSEEIDRMAAAAGVDRAKLVEIIKKDPMFVQQASLLKSLVAERTRIQTSPNLTSDEKAAEVKPIEDQIGILNPIVMSRIKGDGSSSAVPPTTPVSGATVPEVPSISGSRGKPTARSTAYRQGRAYKPTDMKTINGVTKPVSEWRRDYQAATGRPAPF